MPKLSAAETKTMLDAAIAQSPFISFAGMTVDSVDPDKGEVTMTMPARPELMRGTGGEGMFHGGPIASLIDVAGDFAVAAAVGGVVPTINFRVDYFRPAFGSALKAVATLRRAGRTVGIADVDVFDENGKLCAVGRGTYSGTAG